MNELKKVKRLAVIPARGGSKRIPNKNIRNFCGKPMISYILHVAHSSGLFEKIHVSTECFNIRDKVEKLGFPVDFMRPGELADDHTPLIPVLKYVTDTYALRGQQFDQVWLLMACAPLLDLNDLKQAAHLFDSTSGKNPVLAVAEYPVPVEWAFSRAPDGKMTPVQPGMFAIRSQDLGKKYFDAGAFSVFSSANIQASEGAGLDVGFIGYVLPKNKALDIDDEVDWALAETMHRNRVIV